MKSTKEAKAAANRNRRRLREIAAGNRAAYRAFRRTKKRQNAASGASCTAEMSNPGNLLEIEGLQSHFFTDAGTVKAVDGVTLSIPTGKTVAVVGESGCGKSVLSLSIMGLLQGPAGQIAGGAIRFRGQSQTVDLTQLPEARMREIRGKEIAMIFQEPMTSLNPVFPIGRQLDEAIAHHMPEKSKREVRTLSVQMLENVGIPRAEGIYRAYPHELSGGMRQRVMIAMALSCQPGLLIADEPTTALDVTIQAQILELMRELKGKMNTSILLITHDLGVVAEMADYVAVMYAGRIIEQGTVLELYKNPQHPYTVGLLRAKPVLGRRTDMLYSIPGQVPNPISMPDSCYFKSRCDKCCALCDGTYPPMLDISETHRVACWLYGEEDGTCRTN